MSVTTLHAHVINSAFVPTISITAPTPPRLIATIAPQAGGTPTTNAKGASNLPPSYRLLYRGALSLPDSFLLLDGLTFAARLDSPSKQSAFNLLQNPLALALESMRGRPSLRFMGSVNLRDVWLDESGGVEMDIHPHATLTRIYFENMLCLLPFPSTSLSKATADMSEIGIKVALGDSNGPETTEVVIYAQLRPSPVNTIQLSVARVAQQPSVPQSVKRRPRPDDPIPRKPPAFFLQAGKRSGSMGGVGGRELKRVASGTIVGVAPAPSKRQKLVNGGSAADLVFKVPELPQQSKGKGKGKEKEDVFGDVEEVGHIDTAAVQNRKGKPKVDESQGHDVDEGAFEKANKNTIKRTIIEYLSQTKDPTNPKRVIDKSHTEFKDLYGFIYRGVVFAVRAKMRTCAVDLQVMNRLIDIHASMYLEGCGGSADTMC
ncbi:hypothetical protein B0H34DRAFT_653971 [Crassisporium funariophilum]|nr:hypothetical protein B0H34DRAFT_653971 [Crassisporium funariophilum]